MQNLQTPRKAIIRRTMLPGEIAIVNALGTFFYITEAQGSLAVGMGNDTPEPYDVGTGYMGDKSAGEGFTSLRLENRSAELNTVEIVVGFGEYRDNRFTLVPSRDFALPVYEVATEVQGYSGAGYAAGAIAAVTTITLAGTAVAPRVKRKCIIVSNNDAANPLYILDAAGNQVAIVHFGTSITLPVSGPVKVYNNTAAPIPCAISEIWITK